MEKCEEIFSACKKRRLRKSKASRIVRAAEAA